jgi:hypothetical protein
MKSFSILASVLLSMLLLLACGGSARAELRLFPALTLSEIYDDNFFNAEENEVSEYITRFMPSIAVDYEQARVDMSLAYTLDYRYFAKGERGNEAVHYLDFLTLLNWEDRYFFEIADRLAQVSLSSTRDYREESLFNNQSDQNIFSLSPYIEVATSSRGTFKGGYQFIQVTYLDEEGEDKVDHSLFAEQSYELSTRTTASGGYRFLTEDGDEVDFDKHDLWGRLRYEFDENSYLFGTAGFTWIDMQDEGANNDFYWDFGLSHDFDVLVATIGVGVSYIEDPEGSILREENARVAISRDWERSRVSASASISDFYDVDIDKRDTRRYGGTGSFLHEITSRLNGSLVFSAFRYEEDIDDTWTRRLIGSAAFDYVLAEDLTTTLTLYRIESHSPQLPEDRFETNRVFLELKKVF